jgi:hypothetical protein
MKRVETGRSEGNLSTARCITHPGPNTCTPTPRSCGRLHPLAIALLFSAATTPLLCAEIPPALSHAQFFNSLPDAPGRYTELLADLQAPARPAPVAESLVTAQTFAGQSVPGQTSTSQAPVAPIATEQATGTISGIVLDIRDALVSDARVALIGPGGQEGSVTSSRSDGSFSFPNVPAGNVKIKITAPGLESFLSTEISLRAGEKYELPHIALPIASANADVNVTVTERELAEEQVKAEIKQRVFGVFPNFYTSFIWNAAPLAPKQKFELAIRSNIDPVAFLTTAGIAGEEQIRGRFKGYGDGIEGFGRRYGAAYGDNVIGRMIGGAILPTIFHQDPRYFYRGSGSIGFRALYAIGSAIVCKGDNGRWQPNYSHVLGNFAAGGISNLYRPDADRGPLLAINNALIHTAGNAVANLIREFALRGVTTKVPDYATGKQENPAAR